MSGVRTCSYLCSFAGLLFLVWNFSLKSLSLSLFLSLSLSLSISIVLFNVCVFLCSASCLVPLSHPRSHSLITLRGASPLQIIFEGEKKCLRHQLTQMNIQINVGKWVGDQKLHLGTMRSFKYFVPTCFSNRFYH